MKVKTQKECEDFNLINLLPNLGLDHYNYLCVIIDVDHIHRPVRITDEEDRVIIRLQHLKKVNIRPTVDENKVAELQHTHTHTHKILYSV